MTYFEKTIKSFLATMFCQYLECYIIDKDKHFVRNRKMGFIDHIKFIIWNKGRNNDIEASEFFKVFLKKKYETITPQAIGKQRAFIHPDLFINLYKRFIDFLYKKHRHFSEFKGYIVGACDGSIIDLPNVTLTRREFGIKPDTIFKKHRVRSRVSGIMDVNSKFMLTTKIVEKTVKETELAMEHLDDLKKRFNIQKFITIYDRGYKSIELMLYTEKINSKFLIRLPKKAFSNQIGRIKGNDKIIEINLTNSVIKEFERESTKKFAREMGRYYARVVVIRLENGTKETLITNLDAEEFTIDDLKELYRQRWSIETGFKKLKSQIQIEQFSGHRRIIIEQDFYASIFIYNLATAIQWDGEKHMSIQKRNPDDEYIYKSNFASIVGKMCVYMEDILSGDSRTINQVITFLIEQAKRSYHQKNIKDLIIMKWKKIIEDLILQVLWGDDWENKKSARRAKDPSNDNPGTPKHTH